MFPYCWLPIEKVPAGVLLRLNKNKFALYCIERYVCREQILIHKSTSALTQSLFKLDEQEDVLSAKFSLNGVGRIVAGRQKNRKGTEPWNYSSPLTMKYGKSILPLKINFYVSST